SGGWRTAVPLWPACPAHLLERRLVVVTTLLVHGRPASLGLLVDLVPVDGLLHVADRPPRDLNAVKGEQQPSQSAEHDDDAEDIDIDPGEVEFDGPREDRAAHDEHDASGAGRLAYPFVRKHS